MVASGVAHHRALLPSKTPPSERENAPCVYKRMCSYPQHAAIRPVQPVRAKQRLEPAVTDWQSPWSPVRAPEQRHATTSHRAMPMHHSVQGAQPDGRRNQTYSGALAGDRVFCSQANACITHPRTAHSRHQPGARPGARPCAGRPKMPFRVRPLTGRRWLAEHWAPLPCSSLMPTENAQLDESLQN